MMNEKKPWLDENGVRRSEAEIRSLAENWGDKTWEEFLRSTVEKPQNDTLIPGFDYEIIEADARDTYQDMIATNSRPDLIGLVENLLSQLTNREQRVVQAIFWAGRSQHEIARELRLSRSAVRNCQNRALKKMGSLLVRKMLSTKVSERFEGEPCPPVCAQTSIGERRIS